MTGKEWEVVDEVNGDLQAEILRGLLEANGIPVFLSKEGAGHVYAVNIGPLGRVEILVPNERFDQARLLLGKYYSGELEAGGETEPDDIDEELETD